MNCLKDYWFVFDSTLLGAMILENWVFVVMAVALSGFEGSGNKAAKSMMLLRTFRIVRLTRIARVARLCREMPELVILIKGIFAAMRGVLFTMLLLLICLFMFGVALKSLSPPELAAEHFSTVPHAMSTLFMRAALLDDVAELTYRIGDSSWLCCFVWMIFLLFCSLTVMNMLIGILCEVISAVAAVEKEELLVTATKQKLDDVLQALEIDKDGSKTISKEEFCRFLEDPEACIALVGMEVDPTDLVEVMDFIFQGDTINDDEVELPFSKFMDTILSFRGTNSSTVKDIVEIRKFIRSECEALHEEMERSWKQMVRYVDHGLKETVERAVEKGLAKSAMHAHTAASEHRQGAASHHTPPPPPVEEEPASSASFPAPGPAPSHVTNIYVTGGAAASAPRHVTSDPEVPSGSTQRPEEPVPSDAESLRSGEGLASFGRGRPPTMTERSLWRHEEAARRVEASRQQSPRAPRRRFDLMQGLEQRASTTEPPLGSPGAGNEGRMLFDTLVQLTPRSRPEQVPPLALSDVGASGGWAGGFSPGRPTEIATPRLHNLDQVLDSMLDDEPKRKLSVTQSEITVVAPSFGDKRRGDRGGPSSAEPRAMRAERGDRDTPSRRRQGRDQGGGGGSGGGGSSGDPPETPRGERRRDRGADRREHRRRDSFE